MTKDLKASLKLLTKENKKIISHMERYMGARHLNEVCYDELLSDIVGMALECQERGEKFSDAVGMDYELFCHELVINIPKQSMPEQILSGVIWVLYCTGLVVPLLYVYSILFVNFTPATCNGFLFIAPIAYLIKYSVVALILVMGRYFIKRSTYKAQSVVLAVYLFIFMISIIVVDNLAYTWFGKNTFEIHIVVWMLIFLVLSVFSQVAKRLTALGIAYTKRKKESKAANMYTQMSGKNEDPHNDAS
ncbi:MAG TPA: hypothetical protein DCY75_00155 [Clostridiales bacterium]|nr:hypothetical protein [Clostridiales bacterium]